MRVAASATKHGISEEDGINAASSRRWVAPLDDEPAQWRDRLGSWTSSSRMTAGLRRATPATSTCSGRVWSSGRRRDPGWTCRSPSIRPATICRAGPSPPPSNPVTPSPPTSRPSVSFAALRHHLLPEGGDWPCERAEIPRWLRRVHDL